MARGVELNTESLKNMMPGRTPTVLVVDDIPENLDILIENFRDEDIEILVALHGKDALRLVKEHKPDLVLLDIMMPGLSGYEVCKQLKANPELSDIPIIFITAMDEMDDEAFGLSLGAIDYITKPFSVPILKARVRNHLELKMKTDLLAKLACLDGLTGIPNRRHFDEMLKKEWSRGIRNGKPMSLIMIDVDYFKSYNDTYGHGQGDVCLQKVVSVFQTLLKRSSDVLARYGGEEFVVVLPETHAEQAHSIAEQLRLGVVEQDILHTSSDAAPHLSVSVGCATMLPSSDIEPECLLELADKYLYEAKKQGRNRVISESAIP